MKRTNRVLCVRTATVLLVLLIACDGGRQAEQQDGSTPSPRAGTGCANEPSAMDGVENQEGLRGDITGDGALEVARLALDPEGEQGCQVFLIVDGDEGRELERRVLAVTEEGLDLGSASAPRPIGLVDVDGRPGAEVAAVLITGASTELVGFFTMATGELERLQLEGGEVFGSLMPLGGSVAHSTNIICDEEGRLTLVSVTEQEGGYRVARTPFVLEEDSLLADLSSISAELIPADELGGVQELAAPVFDGCPAG